MKKLSERARKARSTKRIALLRDARAILSVACITPSPKGYAICYGPIAKLLNLDKSQDACELADEAWNARNGADEWTPKSEESALDWVNDRLRMEMDE